MIKRIIGLLEKTDGISDYRISTTSTESMELFFVHRSLETVRSTDTTDISVTVYAQHDGRLGEASFMVYSSYDDEKIKEEIEKARAKASIISNQLYSLPENEVARFESDSNLKDYSPEKLAALVAKACFDAEKIENGGINALEIFIYKDTVSVCNSRGINKTEVKYRAMVEAIPTYNGEESVELYEQYNFTEFDYDTVYKEIAERMTEVRDRYYAAPPKEKLSCPVVLGTAELSNLIFNLVSELSFASVYAHANAFSVGDEIQKDATGDKLNVTMCKKIKGSTRSANFDSDGLSLTDRKVIEDGKAIAYYGNTRYAQYLGEVATGSLGCIHTEVGTLSDGEMKKAPYFRCASMSGLQVDIYNDYIGGEVRLGYYFDGEREIPVTGVSISGKLSTALGGLRLSNEENTHGAYKGPKLAMLTDIEIV